MLRPPNFVWAAARIYVHGAPEGEKMESLMQSLQPEGGYGTITADTERYHEAGLEGRACLIDEQTLELVRESSEAREIVEGSRTLGPEDGSINEDHA
jgi:nitroimidazol reductase NimA-like FMN-containing flavoprotein (pyridoxamine 5'-phosphate oxidase superfamily)